MEVPSIDIEPGHISPNLHTAICILELGVAASGCGGPTDGTENGLAALQRKLAADASDPHTTTLLARLRIGRRTDKDGALGQERSVDSSDIRRSSHRSGYSGCADADEITTAFFVPDGEREPRPAILRL